MRLKVHSRRYLLILATLLAIAVQPSTSADELSCLTPHELAAANLYGQLQTRAIAALDQRNAEFAALKTADDVQAWAKKRREYFLEQLGPFPEKTPLNAQTVRTIRAEGYRIECVIFESRPGHHITANLYLPESTSPVPAIVVSSGHSRTAKTADYNQRFALMMVRLGMAALCFDPIGQGERSQVLDDAHQPEHEGTTTEHFLVGIGSTLVGRNTASYRLWDAMRSIDFVCSRPEIDAARIGFTGCSGGGTMTSYVMALDERVTCAAPACYLTNFRKLIETIGPQDAEQNIFGQVSFGLDHPDYIILRGPKPTLISSTTQDFFAIDGSWDTFRQAKRVYGILGAPERVDLVEIEGSHGVQPQNLATIGHWMQRWLLKSDQPVPAREIPVRQPEELMCTDHGQVLQLPGEKSVFDLNAESAAELRIQRQCRWDALAPEQQREQIRNILRLRDNHERQPPKWEDRGRVNRESYHIDRLVLHTDQGHVIPGLTYHPVVPSDEAYLYLHDGGKTAAGLAGGAIEQLVSDGFAVVSIDLRNQGELAQSKADPLLTDWKTYSLAYLLGESMLGLRVEDALNAADFVAFYQKHRDKPRKVHLVAEGAAGIVALHAAAIHPELFTTVTVKGSPESWESLVKETRPSGQLDSVVHGVLRTYDLPDLAKLIGEERLKK